MAAPPRSSSFGQVGYGIVISAVFCRNGSPVLKTTLQPLKDGEKQFVPSRTVNWML